MINQVLRMEQIVQSYVADQQFMGSILVAQNGHVLLDKGYGFANLEWQIPNSSITKFRLGSLTKQFTAVAILLLEEQGQLDITDPINKYLLDAPAAWDNITIFNLLTHTSGIPNYTSFPDFASMIALTKTPEQQIELFRNKPLEFNAGSNYEYCNSGYVLLGYLIEKISGLSYQDYVVENIFKPLAMNDSGYDSHSEIVLQRASGYEITSNGICNTGYLDMSIPYAAGSLYSTTQDLFRWQERLFGGNIISLQSLNKMLQPFKNTYGLGVSIQSLDGHKAITHGGGINGFNTFMIYFPEDKLTIIVLANLVALGFVPQSLGLKIAELVYNKVAVAPLERKEIVLASDTLTQFIGSYTITPENVYYTTKKAVLVIGLENDHLIAQIINKDKIKLFSESKTKFFSKIPDVQIEFFKDERGQVVRLVFLQDGDRSSGVKNC
ncbi:serine hydrolase [Legionella anisa]|uniref:serine hydrolase n=1 Tax=Legionella anisa TaxID=28082 RepID=UPI0010417EF4|nr:serine hydrolase [Legionella anisa]